MILAYPVIHRIMSMCVNNIEDMKIKYRITLPMRFGRNKKTFSVVVGSIASF